MVDKTEVKTSLWMGLFILVLSAIYIFVSLGKVEWVKIIAIIWGFFLAGFLFIQAGIIEYFRKKEYKKIGFGDIVVWITVGIAVMTLVNTALLIKLISDVTPDWLITFSSSIGVFVGVLGGILAVVHIFMPRFK